MLSTAARSMIGPGLLGTTRGSPLSACAGAMPFATGPLLSESGRWEEAEKALGRGSIVCRTRIPTHPPTTEFYRQLVAIENELGLLYLHTDRPGLALEDLRHAP